LPRICDTSATGYESKMDAYILEVLTSVELLGIESCTEPTLIKVEHVNEGVE
jgi:hypothetical protein